LIDESLYDEEFGMDPTKQSKCSEVNHPEHYNKGKYEVIDVIEDWGLNFHLGNAVKYIARAPHKGDMLSDLRKALWYLQREIERRCKPEAGSWCSYHPMVSVPLADAALNRLSDEVNKAKNAEEQAKMHKQVLPYGPGA
jgi:hypothetical protein